MDVAREPPIIGDMSERELFTKRLRLSPIDLPLVEAVMAGDRAGVERLCGASFPKAWPGRALIERAFTASLDAIRRDPEGRLWGDHLLLLRHEPRVVGSVVFHGAPDDEGVVEVAYGVEDESQGKGFATEGVSACVAWALAQPGVRAVRATTLPWHTPSLRVIAKIGMVKVGMRDSELLGEMIVFETRTKPALAGA